MKYFQIVFVMSEKVLVKCITNTNVNSELFKDVFSLNIEKKKKKKK